MKYLLFLSTHFRVRVLLRAAKILVLLLDLISISFGWQKEHVISLD